LARSERFELPTLGFEVRCSIQLSYERINVFNGLVGNSHPWPRPRTEDSGRKIPSTAPTIRIERAELPKENAAGVAWLISALGLAGLDLGRYAGALR
jgi:hypothetical protein